MSKIEQMGVVNFSTCSAHINANRSETGSVGKTEGEAPLKQYWCDNCGTPHWRYVGSNEIYVGAVLGPNGTVKDIAPTP